MMRDLSQEKYDASRNDTASHEAMISVIQRHWTRLESDLLAILSSLDSSEEPGELREQPCVACNADAD